MTNVEEEDEEVVVIDLIQTSPLAVSLSPPSSSPNRLHQLHDLSGGEEGGLEEAGGVAGVLEELIRIRDLLREGVDIQVGAN
jgi:hypothetical protein